jgi:hypothetical protein
MASAYGLEIRYNSATNTKNKVHKIDAAKQYMESWEYINTNNIEGILYTANILAISSIEFYEWMTTEDKPNSSNIEMGFTIRKDNGGNEEEASKIFNNILASFKHKQ